MIFILKRCREFVLLKRSVRVRDKLAFLREYKSIYRKDKYEKHMIKFDGKNKM